MIRLSSSSSSSSSSLSRSLLLSSGSSSSSLLLFSPAAAASLLGASIRHFSYWHLTGENHNRSAFEVAERSMERNDIRGREMGRVYRKHQSLWPSLSALEKDITQTSFAPAERLPPELLPRDIAELQLSGSIPEPLPPLLSEKEETKSRPVTMTLVAEAESDRGTEEQNAPPLASKAAEMNIKEHLLKEEDELDLSDLDSMMMAQVVESSRSQSAATSTASSAMLQDLSSNDTSTPVASWAAAGLDPVLADRATEVIGPGVTSAQSRLLPALLNDAHNDVLFGSVTGSGKTVALLLALLQGIRKETAGVNIFIASDAINAQRAIDFLMRMGGPEIADCLTGDEDIDLNHNNWLFLADRRERNKQYCKALLATLEQQQTSPTPSSVRLIVCTADVLCELLFQHKFEFAPFGNLRRVMVDDVSKDIRFASPTAPFEEKVAEYSNPSATQLALATVHQLLPAHLRSLLQIGIVAADLESDLSRHLMSLCVKPSAHTLIACSARLPTTLHCVFSFFASNPSLSSPVRRLLDYLCRLLRNADAAIPGRVIIFFDSSCDLVEMRALLLRHHGMDAKLLFEVHSPVTTNNGGASAASSWATGWRFLLLHEHEGFGLDIPLVSHVVLTFPPRNRFSLLHLAGRAARGGRPGWCFTIAPRTQAQSVAAVCKELDVSVVNNTVDVKLNNVPPEVVRRWTDPPPSDVLDPRRAVAERYERAEDPGFQQETMFSHPRDQSKRHRDMQLDDHTPMPVLERRLDQARRLHRDLALSPELALDYARQGLVDPDTLKPTKKLIEIFDDKNNAHLTTQKFWRNLERADPLEKRRLLKKMDPVGQLSRGISKATW